MAENSQSCGVSGISTPSEGETHIDPFEAFKDPSRRLQPRADDRRLSAKSDLRGLPKQFGKQLIIRRRA